MKTALLTTLCALTIPLLGAADPFTGLWKLNSGKSKFEAGAPGLMQATIQIEPSGNGLKSSAGAADDAGIASDLTFNCQLDGTPCQVTASTPMKSASSADTVTLKRVDQNKILATGTRKGMPVYSDSRVVSADGKTLTVSRDGTTPQGKHYKSTIVLDRVR